MVLAGFSFREIGRRIGKHHGSISRAIKRNSPTYADDAVYWYYDTHPTAIKRRHKARHCRRHNHSRLRTYIETKIRLDWPPEAIAARLRLDFPDDAQMRISNETIYRFWEKGRSSPSSQTSSQVSSKTKTVWLRKAVHPWAYFHRSKTFHYKYERAFRRLGRRYA